jgi:sugar/nucleoside kinase (ribokinase family)
MKILCIGQSTLDISLPLDQPVIENLKFRVYDKLESAGGPSTTAAILLGLWGEDVTLASRLGPDIYATHIKETLSFSKVKTLSIPCTDFSTPISVILTNKANGNRTIFNCPGTIAPTEFRIDETMDILLCDGHEPQITHRYLDQHPHIVSVLDAGGYRPETVELAKRVTWLVSSQTFAENYAGVTIDINNPQTWSALYLKLHELNAHPIVTLGDLGCLYEENGLITHMPSYPAIAIDTNGAGDIFHGAFVYGLAHHLSLRAILSLASMASAISVTRRGGSLSIPSLQEVQDALSKQ